MTGYRALIGKAVRNPRKAARVLRDRARQSSIRRGERRDAESARMAAEQRAAQVQCDLVTATGLLKSLPVQEQVKVRSSLRPVVRLDFPDADLMLSADTDVDLMRANACYKEPETVAWIKDTIRAGDVFYDIGANVGAYSLIAAAVSGGEAKVQAFEPSFSTYAQLCKNVLLNSMQDTISPFLIALGDETRFAVLNYTTVQAGAALHALGDPRDQTGVSFIPAYSQVMPAFSVDDLVARWGIESPTLVKLDVDGTEMHIIEGARKTLASGRVRSVLVEVYDLGDKPKQVELLMESVGLALAVRFEHGGNVANYVFERSTDVTPERQRELESLCPQRARL